MSLANIEVSSYTDTESLSSFDSISIPLYDDRVHSSEGEDKAEDNVLSNEKDLTGKKADFNQSFGILGKVEKVS